MRYVGHLNFAPKCHTTPGEWKLEEPFAQLTSDNHLIICKPWVNTDGASIPRALWPVIGHPFRRDNAFWSQPHDQGYNGSAVVFNMDDLSDVLTPEKLISPAGYGHYVYDDFRVIRKQMSRKWFDKKCVEGMKIMGVGLAKRMLVYWGIRSWGWRSFQVSR